MAINNMQRMLNPANMLQGLSVQNLQQNYPIQNVPIEKIGGGGNWLTGYKAGINRIPLGSPGQIAATEQLLQQGLGSMNRNPNFEPYATQARQQLQENTLPSLFARINALGGAQGPAAGMLASKAMSDLEGQLALGRSQFDQGQQQLGLQQAQMGMTPMYYNQLQPETSGALPGILSLLGMIIGGAATGGAGAGIGGAAGSAIAQLLQSFLNSGGNENNFDIDSITKGFGNNQFSGPQFMNRFNYQPQNQGYLFGQQNNGGYTI